jgi:hypothetical protein
MRNYRTERDLGPSLQAEIQLLPFHTTYTGLGSVTCLAAVIPYPSSSTALAITSAELQLRL